MSQHKQTESNLCMHSGYAGRFLVTTGVSGKESDDREKLKSRPRKGGHTANSWPCLSDQASALPWIFPRQARREIGQEMFTVLELKGSDESSQALGGH